MTRLWIVIALAAVGCKSSDKTDKTDKSDKPRDAAAKAPVVLDAATPVAVAPDATPAPKFPPLGAPPAGMDEKLATACDAGDGKACLAAAQAYEPKGAFRVSMTKEEGDLHEEWTRRYGGRACEYDLGDGCALAAKFSRGSTAAEQEALLRRGCDLGHPGACGDLGAQLVEKQDTAPEGLALLEKGCRGDGISMYNPDEHGRFCDAIAKLYGGKEKEYVAKDEARAKELKALGCQQGFKLGCPCTEATEAQDCGVSDDYDYFCDENGLCDIMSPD